jgi:hypothetical protein
LGFSDLLKDSGKTVSGIVDHHIYTPELVKGCFKGSIDIGFLGDVKLERKVVLPSLARVRKRGWVVTYLISSVLEAQ